jgi:hypothetical protein
MEKRGRTRKQLLDDFKEARGYWKLKENSLWKRRLASRKTDYRAHE